MLADCGETAEEGERFAFLAPDNQTGDASLDWASNLVHRGLAAGVGYSISADTIADARLASGGYNRIVYSTLTHADSGEVRLHSAIFDATGHQFNREFTVSGNVLQVINRMSTSINPEAYALGAKSVDDLRKWPSLEGTLAELESQCQAVAESDPGFGAALGWCADQLASRGRSEALRSMLQAIPETQWREFSPEVQDSFGKSYNALKDYARAAVIYRVASAKRAEMKNMLGYAEALSGRCEAGKQALEAYQRAVPREEANALDSLGEVSYFCGQYKDAEKYFLESASSKWPNPQMAILEPIKAAAARIMTGDAAGANQIAGSQIEKLTKSNPQAATGLKPLWASIAAGPTAEERKKAIETSLIRRP